LFSASLIAEEKSHLRGKYGNGALTLGSTAELIAAPLLYRPQKQNRANEQRPTKANQRRLCCPLKA